MSFYITSDGLLDFGQWFIGSMVEEGVVGEGCVVGNGCLLDQALHGQEQMRMLTLHVI